MLRKMKNMFGDKQITTADLYQEMADYNSRLQECLKQKEELEKQEKYAIYENDPDNLAKIDNQIKTLKGQIKALGKMIKAKRRLFPIVERDEHHSTLNTELCAVLKAVEIAANDFRKKWQELEESMVYLVALEQLADNQIERLRSYAEKIGAQRPNISPVMKRLANNGERWASFSDRLRLPRSAMIPFLL
jgi:chromosome segregation ATPase